MVDKKLYLLNVYLTRKMRPQGNKRMSYRFIHDLCTLFQKMEELN